MNVKPKVALAQDFLVNLAKLPSAVQGKVLKWALRFQADPTSTGTNYETIQGSKDRNLKSVRIDLDWRGIVFKAPAGDIYVLMYVDHHEAAYRWAEGRRVAVNPATGSLQVFAVESIAETAPKPLPATGDEHSTQADDSATATRPAFTALTDQDLLSLGTPPELLAAVRAISCEADLDAAQALLPVEAYEGLFLILAGDTLGSVLAARESRAATKVDIDDFAAALETPEAQSRFVVVADEETMAAILNSPLAQWRVFLHPTQRKIAHGDRSGPMRVLGGGGTGKTVLAMHRAKWLAEQRASADHKVFFTTFTRNLAADIEENLKTLCSPATMQNIEVKNLDAWVHSFLRRHKYEHTIIYDRKQGDAKEAWQSALALQDSSLALPADFYEEELEKIVLAQGVASRDDYRLAKRTGRSTVLNRSKRDAIWPVFEEYRAQLASRKLKEVDDAYRDAAKLLQGKAQTYYAVIVDETQDFGPQALRLLRAMVAAAPNDLFFVGDGHQRIYTRHRASMTACGIDIRGRSRKLYLNYRTTEEIRRAAVAALEGCEVDDLDDGSDEARRYKSLSHGPVPQTLTFDHMEGALREVASLARAGVEQGRSVCVIVPDTKNSGEVAANLKSENLATTILGPEERDQPGSTSVRIATMHRAKGLEFDEVVLLVPRSWSQGGDRPVNAGQLQYVALTRAKRRACVVRY
jgi:hypothetical protein